MTASFDWESLSEAPAEPGVYAWYLGLAIPQADLAAAEAAIFEAQRAGDEQAMRRAAQSLLERTVSDYFSELAYNAQIWGPLSQHIVERSNSRLTGTQPFWMPWPPISLS